MPSLGRGDQRLLRLPGLLTHGALLMHILIYIVVIVLITLSRGCCFGGRFVWGSMKQSELLLLCGAILASDADAAAFKGSLSLSPSLALRQQALGSARLGSASAAAAAASAIDTKSTRCAIFKAGFSLTAFHIINMTWFCWQ